MTWIPLIVALIALVGVIVNAVITYKNNKALDARWRTELKVLEDRTQTAAEADERKDKRAKAIDIYKWASELAVSTDPRIAQTGVDALKGLLMGQLLDDDMKALVAATLGSSYAIEGSMIERALEAGEEVDVVQADLEAKEVEDVASLQTAGYSVDDKGDEDSGEEDRDDD